MGHAFRTFEPVGLVACPSSEGRISTSTPVAEVNRGPFSLSLVSKTKSLITAAKLKLFVENYHHNLLCAQRPKLD